RGTAGLSVPRAALDAVAKRPARTRRRPRDPRRSISALGRDSRSARAAVCDRRRAPRCVRDATSLLRGADPLTPADGRAFGVGALRRLRLRAAGAALTSTVRPGAEHVF